MDMEKKHMNNIASMSYEDQINGSSGEQNFRHALFFGLFEDPERKRLQSGSMKRQYSDMGDNYHRVYEHKEEEEKKRIDVRVLMLLEYFRELYVREIQVLKKIFPGVKDEFVDFFKKVGEAMPRIKRSQSLGSLHVAPRAIDPMANERFKVTTVSTGGTSGGPTGQGQTKK
ncbi:PREDICTED: uncharacterized protein LOC104803169 [Tarenaya hassleriana]|uniref:uncharacterized protein LOC104803169 n=1 Tax=Tarenaya hassleriana TaxID=28532 RepID=UPI00053C552C|nr:PREDICTED: uncharacterized protein LOC104803169 [Tarenaya hassleriana]